MRRHRVLRNSSTQSLCIFCACRLSGQVAPSTAPQRRLINTSGRANQQAAAQAAPQQPAPQQQQWSFDPTSRLSPSEQREKEGRLQRHRAQQEREAAARQAKEKEDNERQIRRFKEEEAAREAARKAHQQDNEERRARSEEQKARRQEAQQRDREARNQQSQRDRAEARGRNPRHAQQAQRNPDEQSDIVHRRLDLGTNASENNARSENTRDVNQRDRNQRTARGPFDRDQVSQVQPSQQRQQRHPHRTQSAPVFKAEQRVQMPKFGGSTQPVEEVTTGWGGGSPGIKPLQYKTDEDIERERVEEVEREKRQKREKQDEAQRVADAAREERRRSHEQRQQQAQRDREAPRASSAPPRPERREQSRSTPPPPPPQPFDSPFRVEGPQRQQRRELFARGDNNGFSQFDKHTYERDSQSPSYTRPPSPSPADWIRDDTEGQYKATPLRSHGSDYQRRPPQQDVRPSFELERQPRQERRETLADDERKGSLPFDRYIENSGMRPRSQANGQRPPPAETSFDLDRQYEATPFKSTEYQRPSPQQDDGSYDGQGQYRATPFKSTDYQPSSKGEADQQYEHTWEHLAPRKKASASVPPPSQQQQQQRQPRLDRQYQAFPLDDQTINRNFEEHRSKRSAPARSPLDNPNISDRLAPDFLPRKPRQTTRCARCWEYGHSAPECIGPIKCSSCGQTGHPAATCPNKRRNTRERSAPREDAFTSQTEAPRAPQNVFRRTPSEGFDALPEKTEAVAEKTEPFFYRPTRSSGAERSPAKEARSETLDRGTRQIREERDEREQSQPSTRQSHGWAGLEEEAEEVPDERLSRLKRRGFVEPEEEAEEAAAPRSFERRKEGRGGRRRDQDEDADDEALAAREERAAKKAARKAQEKAEQEKRKAARAAGERAGGGSQVHLPEFVSVSNLAQQLGIGYDPFVQRLEQLGYDDVFPGKVLNRETSGMIAMEYDFDPVYEGAGSVGAKSEEEERDLKAALEVEDMTFLPTRPPVVTIMGHVDHGKTTILDYLRRTSVAAGEAGGITQHIGAFSVPLSSSGRTITFLDTPGHAAFMSMRQRGANVTDIVILVVAADDSVKPQTLESIRCAREAGVPMIVAVNKVDKPEADVQKVKNDLSRHGVEIEDFGGDVQVVEVSGKTGQGLDALEENVVTLSEILDHRSDTEGAVEGWVLEATTKRAGRVATILVKRGTLRPGAILVAGKTWARVRSLRDERNQNLMEVGPGMPVEVDGWRDQPAAGDEVLQAPGEQKATDVVAYRLEKGERLKMEEDMEAINETRRAEQERRKAAEKAAKAAAAAAEGQEGDTAPGAVPDTQPDEQTTAGGQQTIPFIIKADVSGSAEAVAAYIPSLTSPLIAPSILASTVGAINESDIELASASKGHIVAFNLPKNEEMRGLAESKGVMVLENNIIYRTLEQVKEVLEAQLPEVKSQRVVGEADVGQVFEIGVGGRKKVKIAGCKVRNGAVARNSRVRVLRAGEKVYDGTITSLKNVKKDVQEMRKGTECGMGFDGWEDFQEGDQIQTYEETSEKRKL